nr:MAG TPA: hypothetical protein [Caudoviricetes sp.]
MHKSIKEFNTPLFIGSGGILSINMCLWGVTGVTV